MGVFPANVGGDYHREPTEDSGVVGREWWGSHGLVDGVPCALSITG